jgi:CheY-like chemotaxis protein
MEESVRIRATEPFFTTKPPGMGSGLGLASVHGIMRQHEGTLEIESAPGAGTTVRCLFPAIEIKVDPAAGLPTLPEAGAGRQERVLFLDDEPSLSRLGERYLTSLGYLVTGMTRADAALAHLATATVDIMVTDYTMPEITGLEVARRARAAGFRGPILLLSGMAAELDHEACRQVGIDRILGKPLGVADLGRAVREALDRAAAAPTE